MANFDATITKWGPQGPAGTWIVTGTTPRSEKYNGSLSLIRSGSILTGTFQADQIGKRSCTGIIFNGLFLLARSREETRPGLVWYTLASNGDLEAVWNRATLKGMTATGRATSGQPGVIPGKRAITYFDPNGNALEPPALDLVICQNGPVYILDWKDRASGEVAFTGMGLDIPNGLTSVWAEAKNGPELDILVYTLDAASSGKKADATWTSTGSDGKVGDEQIRRY